MTRPIRLTKKVKEAIYRGIRLGLAYDRAAQLAGITPRTFYSWKAKGIAKKAPIYIQFLHELKKAEIEGEAAAINEIVKASRKGTWQASAWLLERRFPDRWSRVQKFEIAWRTEVIGLIQSGSITAEDVRDELGDELAQELFESAGIQIAAS